MSKPQRQNPGKHAANRREQAMAMAMKRKEEYLGARVPKALKERVIKKADEMNIPVSLLIRRLLEETFPESGAEAGGRFTLNVGGAVSNIVENAPVATPSADRYADIIGWKQIEVNQDRSCERCKEPLPKGSVASLGFTTTDSGYVIVCHQCKAQLINA